MSDEDEKCGCCVLVFLFTVLIALFPGNLLSRLSPSMVRPDRLSSRSRLFMQLEQPASPIPTKPATGTTSWLSLYSEIISPVVGSVSRTTAIISNASPHEERTTPPAISSGGLITACALVRHHFFHSLLFSSHVSSNRCLDHKVR